MGKLIKNKKVINEKAQNSINELERDMERESRLSMIQALIPLGLKAVEAELQAEIMGIVGGRYERSGDIKRWGSNPGSLFLGDQKVKVSVPRARNIASNEEIQLATYERLQSSQRLDDMALSRVMYGMSQRNYEKAATHVPETFGIKKTSVCRKFIKASGKKLKEFMERDLSGYDIVAIFIDGKHFADNEIIIALGITITGEKILLGFVETSTENHKVCKNFINEIKGRGLSFENEILFIIDGSKGLSKGIKEVIGKKANIQRCQWHKRENILSYLDKKNQVIFRRKLQAAYQLLDYKKAKARLLVIRNELLLINESAAASLDEGFEETLTLHRLKMFGKIGDSFKTTNCIESVNKQLAIHTDRVDHWQNSNQRQRWIGTSLLIIESRLRTVKGFKHLKELREAMKIKVNEIEFTEGDFELAA
jgi:transposase-like protein